VSTFLGNPSGQSAASDLKKKLLPLLEQHVLNWRDKVLVVYASVVGYEDGIGFVQAQMGDDAIVICLDTLSNSDKAFDQQNAIFSTFEERERALEIAKRIGTVLEPKWPLGWENSEALVVFPENIPNNSLPILYKEGRKYQERPWTPLFPRS